MMSQMGHDRPEHARLAFPQFSLDKLWHHWLHHRERRHTAASAMCVPWFDTASEIRRHGHDRSVAITRHQRDSKDWRPATPAICHLQLALYRHRDAAHCPNPRWLDLTFSMVSTTFCVWYHHLGRISLTGPWWAHCWVTEGLWVVLLGDLLDDPDFPPLGIPSFCRFS